MDVGRDTGTRTQDRDVDVRGACPGCHVPNCVSLRPLKSFAVLLITPCLKSNAGKDIFGGLRSCKARSRKGTKKAGPGV